MVLRHMAVGEWVCCFFSGGIYNVRVQKHWNRRSRGYTALRAVCSAGKAESSSLARPEAMG